jgi:stage III sporulation protein AA
MRREKKDQILAVLPEKIRGILLNHGLDFEKIQEIRLREEQPLAVKKEGKEELFTHRVTKEELRETMEYVSNYSLYAYENELRQGFLTIEGGHRVGISGKIISEKEQIRNFQYITSINIRICHEITGCANKLFPVILEKGRLCHTMIISPPGGGKTTLLRIWCGRFRMETAGWKEEMWVWWMNVQRLEDATVAYHRTSLGCGQIFWTTARKQKE